MVSQKNNLNNYSPTDQLALLKNQCKHLSPEIYKDHALYLQYIRKYLKKNVRDLIFILFLESKNSFNRSQKGNLDSSFQNNIDDLVDRTSSLLTIEHLIDLSRQLRNEARVKQEIAKEQFLKTLESQKNKSIKVDDSVELSLSPPIESIDSLNSWLDDDFDYQSTLHQESDDNSRSVHYSDKNINNSESLSLNRNKDNADQLSQSSGREGDIFRSIFLMASDVFSGDAKKRNKDQKDLGDKVIDSNIGEESLNSLLPDNPKDMINWMNSFELALSRRLINLSHAINIELLRNGIINTLLPLNLLEAVSGGAIETLDSTPNLLKIRVPLSNSFLEDGFDISCLLLRPSEFEFDQPLLRRCRSLLKRDRNVLMKLLRKQSHWEDRSFEIEIKEKWWKNP